MRRNKVATAIDSHVGERVRARRQMLKISQTALGDALGLSYQQIQKYENGINRVSPSRLQQLANVLRVPVASFFEGAPSSSRSRRVKEATPDYVSAFLATEDGVALIRAFMQIKQRMVRRLFVRLAQEIVATE
jgi:transcriptional regulator with XRE-family HTH domain